MLVWRKILAHGLKRLATPALHLWRIRHGLVEELALCIKSLATPDLESTTQLDNERLQNDSVNINNSGVRRSRRIRKQPERYGNPISY